MSKPIYEALEDLEAERLEVLESMDDIETQIEMYENGERDCEDETWPRRARAAKRHMRMDVAKINVEIKALTRQIQDEVREQAASERAARATAHQEKLKSNSAKMERIKASAASDRDSLTAAKEFILQNLGQEKLEEFYNILTETQGAVE